MMSINQSHGQDWESQQPFFILAYHKSNLAFGFNGKNETILQNKNNGNLMQQWKFLNGKLYNIGM